MQIFSPEAPVLANVVCNVHVRTICVNTFNLKSDFSFRNVAPLDKCKCGCCFESWCDWHSKLCVDLMRTRMLTIQGWKKTMTKIRIKRMMRRHTCANVDACMKSWFDWHSNSVSLLLPDVITANIIANQKRGWILKSFFICECVKAPLCFVLHDLGRGNASNI